MFAVGLLYKSSTSKGLFARETQGMILSQDFFSASVK